MTYDEVVERLTSKSFFSAQAGLYRMRKVLEHFGNPQNSLQFIHVAGTNGKGSVCAMLQSVLTAAGYKTGLYTSPYIYDFRERIQIDGELISREKMAAIGEEVLGYTEKLFEKPNQFELITIMVMLYFYREQCDLVVLETGLGGTFDSTNVISKPLVSIITNIGLDHCSILGNTIEEIAQTKAGIIKPNGKVIVYPVEKKAMDVILTEAAKKNAKVIPVLAGDVCRMREQDFFGEVFRYKNYPVRVGLAGEYQCYNCALVLEAINVLNQGTYFISDDDIEKGLGSVKWPARLERLCTNPPIYVDGGHNPQGLGTVVQFLKERHPQQKHIYVLGMLKDKDFDRMLTEVKEDASAVYFVYFENPRGFSEEEYVRVCEQYELQQMTLDFTPLATMVQESEEEVVIACAGSLYLAADFHKAVKEAFVETKA